jgi:hypothetical protein
MKQTLVVILLIVLFIFSENAFSQRRRSPEMGKGPRPERLEQLKKMRLIEVLKLSEEEAVRFFARQSAHEDKVMEMMKQRNDILDDLQNKIHDKAEPAVIDKLTDQVLNIDQQIFQERQRFQGEQRKSLTPEQFAKFLAFERNFGRQVRDAVGEMYRERMHDKNDE